MILFTQAQRDAVRGDYDGQRLEPVKVVDGLYFLPNRLAAEPVFASAELDQYPTTDDLEATARAHMLDLIAARRWVAIRDGFTFGGSPVTLDDRAQARIDTAIAGLKRQPSGATVEWEVARGVFQTMDLATLEALGDAAFAHVQACFSNSKPMMQAATDAADIAALNAIDLEAGWP